MGLTSATKDILINAAFTIPLLFLGLGHLGLGIFSAHWFSLLRSPFWNYFDKPGLKESSISIFIIHVLVFILFVLLIIKGRVAIFGSIISILMFTCFGLVIYILTQTTNAQVAEIYELAPKVLQRDTKFETTNRCTWNESLTTNLADCNQLANEFVQLITDRTFNWFLFYFCCWIVSICIILPAGIILYRRSNTDSHFD